MIEQAVLFIGNEGLSDDYHLPTGLDQNKTESLLSKLKYLVYGNDLISINTEKNDYHSLKVRILENVKIDSTKPLDGIELTKVRCILSDKTFPIAAIASIYHSYASLTSLLESGASWQDRLFAHSNKSGNMNLNALEIAHNFQDGKALEILQDQVVDDVNLMICKIKYELSVSDDHDDLVNLLGWVSSKPACLMRASENTSGSISERYAQSSKELQDVKGKLLRRIMKLRKDNENKTAVETVTRDLNEENKQLMTKKLV